MRLNKSTVKYFTTLNLYHLKCLQESLKQRSIKMVRAFNSMTGVKCQPAHGAMYTFPRISIPDKAVKAALAMNKAPDVFYCLEMLDATGVCVVPGSGFGQVEGTFHFRSTFLPPEEEFDAFLERIKIFHEQFMKKYE